MSFFPPLSGDNLYIPRIIDEKIKKILERKSVMLLGPRQTGKSSLLREQIPSDLTINLLNQSTFLNLSKRLSSLRESLKPEQKTIVIDEIQKLPQLMDEIHLMIEEMGRKFVLTGSSARKIRRSYTKLMGGRTSSVYLHPLVYPEVRNHFDLERILSFGLLPGIYHSPEPYSDLVDYVGDYLQQEILAEAVTRGVDQYARFLLQIASSTCQVLNIQKIANDAQVSPSSVRRFIEILSDTMLATQLESWSKSRSRKAVSKTKLILFDVGVANALLEISKYNALDANAGWQFEQYIGQELLAYRDYHEARIKLNFWRTVDKHEVDFVLNDHTAIEVKHTSLVSERDLKGLLAISEEQKWKNLIVVSRDEQPRRIGNIQVLPVRDFLEKLWAKELD